MGNRMKSVFIFMLIFSLFSCRYSKTVGSHHCDEYVDYKFPADYREKKQSLEEIGNLQDVNDFTMDLEGNFYFLENGCRIKKFNPEMNFIAQIYPQEGEQIQLLTGQKIAVDHYGNFYVYDSEFKGLGHCYRPKIKKISSQGKIIDFFWGGESFYLTDEIKMMDDFIIIANNHCYLIYDLEGNKKLTFPPIRIINVIKKEANGDFYLLCIRNGKITSSIILYLIKIDKNMKNIDYKILKEYEDSLPLLRKTEEEKNQPFFYLMIQNLNSPKRPFITFFVEKYDYNGKKIKEWELPDWPELFDKKLHIIYPGIIRKAMVLKNQIYFMDIHETWTNAPNSSKLLNLYRIIHLDMENQKMTVLKEWLY